ncbi:ShlB/FhaC/HecB family hemolysin secretion/activation protein [Polaribacter porphyrae]|uniref:ShlB/FhaC/HecB family hemolysin secretion/activation protein n=1 Tax=Polaribacter porphyrae TaxID=1137780 RepID=UPI0011B06CE0|nr:ShlB/FhaC/HecB family hemolysin secretion/activation protein [Polaribacter porphyrae]
MFSQELSLIINSKKENEKLILKKIDFKKKHNDSVSVYIEISKISSYLKKKGFFTNTIDSITIKNHKIFIAYFSLNKKVNKALISISEGDKVFFDEKKIKKNSVEIPIKELQVKLEEISKKLDLEGRSFSKVKLENIKINNNILFAELKIYQSKKRKFNKVIVKGYINFPKSFLKNYFNIKDNTVFNKEKIKNISLLTKSLEFVKEIKSPEVLFTKDSTSLYLYLKKRQNNSFDGIVNFASKENGGILFNGNIDLKLSNVLNTGEKFNLFWNSIGNERQEFKISSEIPFIFNSKFSPKVIFSIYKQDSTFLNTKFESKVFYNINSKAKLALTYNTESSENTDTNINNNIETFDNYFFGINFQYRVPKNDVFFNNKLYININPSFGQRKTQSIKSNQLKLTANASYIFDLSKRSSIYIKNETGYLNSNNYFDNELFRIGGANSIRGFNEQSLFTNNYSYFNLEYRYLTSTESFLYSITDFGGLNTVKSQQNFLTLGLGYLFIKNKSIININISLAKKNRTNVNIQDTKLIISLVTMF